MQSVAFSMNSCQQFGLPECTVQVTLNLNRPSNKSTHLRWRTENNARNPLFFVLTDG